jgi:hypothetical protein
VIIISRGVKVLIMALALNGRATGIINVANMLNIIAYLYGKTRGL